MIDLKKTSSEIRELLQIKREELQLSFIEDTHTYYMKDSLGVLRSDFKSVTSIIKNFATEFDTEGCLRRKCNGDKEKMDKLRSEWEYAGYIATNMGSRTHFYLEQHLIDENGKYKEVRRPIFECDEHHINKSDNMIKAGKDFVKEMDKRGAVLLDTEVVLGDPELRYVGQPDKTWLILNKNKSEFGLVISDWKSNKPTKFEVKPYHGYLKPPFNNYRDYDLTHYYLQIPLYARLLIKMLKGTKYENMKFYGGIVVLLKDDGTFTEFRIPNEIYNKILEMDLKPYLK